ncbi:MAG: DUF2279 domain-containing protein [Flavisolibacter sp.]
MMRKSFLYIFLLLTVYGYSQDSANSLKDPAAERYKLEQSSPDSEIVKALRAKNIDRTSPNYSGRKWMVGIGTAAVYGTSFIYLNEAWYKGYPRSSFHTFNDVGEWMQMDKIGHAWSAYTTGRLTYGLWRWTGMNQQHALLLGPGTSLLYMLSIEYLDGLSAEWGWSWGDAGADLTGTLLFSVQELGWKEQKIQLKFSSHRASYDPTLNARANDLFGKSLYERTLKDYNAQTYWLSFNINSFLKKNGFPNWLNLAVGYGAEGMLGGYENVARDKNGDITFDRRDITRYRQFYIAPDIDLTKIKTNNKLLRTVFFTLNSLKFPAPALEFSKGKVKVHGFAF